MHSEAAPLPAGFFERDAVEVARDLLGAHLVRDAVVLRVTEVEAYPPGDSASHCRAGRTARNAPMWGPPGHAYVYLCYGLHAMLNVVTNPDGVGAGVLVRACEPVSGHDVVRARRGGREGRTLLDGPGKVGQALALDARWTGRPMFQRGPLFFAHGSPPARIATGPRVGIDFAGARDRRALWRFGDADSEWVSHRSGLRVRTR